MKPQEGLGIKKMFNYEEFVVEYEVTAEVWVQRVEENVIWGLGRRCVLTGWLKGFGSEGRMCRWAIMAWSRSLSFASCEIHKGGY